MRINFFQRAFKEMRSLSGSVSEKPSCNTPQMGRKNDIKNIQYDSDELERFIDPKTGLQGLKHKDGRIILPAENVIIKLPSHQYLPVKQVFGHSYLYGYADTEGNICVPCQFSYARGFSNGVAFVMDGSGKWGAICPDGRWQLEPVYEDAGVFKENIASVKIGGHWGLIDKQGNKLSAFVYDKTDKMRSGYMAVAKSVPQEGKKVDKWGVLNSDGVEVVPCIYDSITRLENGYSEFEIDGKKGIFDKDFQEICGFRYDKIKPFVEERALFCVNGVWGVVDTEYNIVTKPSYDVIYDYDFGLAQAWKRGQKYIIDRSGNYSKLFKNAS